MGVGETTRVFIQVNILKQHVTKKLDGFKFDQNKESIKMQIILYFIYRVKNRRYVRRHTKG